MGKFNMRHWISGVIGQDQRSAMPIMTHPGIQMTGNRVIDAVTHGDIHFRAIKAMADHFPSLAATMIMDLTVEAEAFGCSINFTEDEVPAVSGRLVNDFESVQRLNIPSLTSGRVPEYLRAARLAAENIHDRPVLGGCIGPFSLAGRLFDMTEIMTAAFLEPETIKALLEKCTIFLRNYARQLKKNGMNGLIMAEPAAGLLDESMCDAFSSVYIKRIAQDVQDDDFIFILHNCGNTGHVTQSMIRTGAHGLHFGNRINIIQALKEVPSHILVFGNLDPVTAFKLSSPLELKRMTSELLNASSDYPNFVISSGCDTPPGVSLANVCAFYDALHEYNAVPVKC